MQTATLATSPAASGLHIAPMMRYSHRHGRMLWRHLCPPAVLYTEMLAAAAVVRADSSSLHRMLFLPPEQKPAIVQLAAGDVETMARAAGICAKWGYDAVNINCGCPSGRAQKGNFGACLMASPKLAGALVRAAKSESGLPVTVKCRTAIDDADVGECLFAFADAVGEGGACAIIVHARRALLKGLSPKQNRAAPPLDYETPQKLRGKMPQLPVIVNGGITSADDVVLMLRRFDGVMIGRAAVQNPYILADIGRRVYDIAPPSRRLVLQRMLAGAAKEPAREWRRIAVSLGGLFYGEPGAAKLRRQLASAYPLPLSALQF
ncbi:MAG: tRNA dihydrouridine(20/20a) synthase DusA [Gammaproteobacteria bacterium]